MSNVSYRKDNLTTTTCLAGFFYKNNYIIILLQSTMIYILVNKKINNETLNSFNILYNNFIQCPFILVFRIIFYLYFLIIKYNHLPINYLHCFVNCYWIIIVMSSFNLWQKLDFDFLGFIEPSNPITLVTVVPVNYANQ